MRSSRRLVALTAAVSLAMLLGGSAVSSVYAEGPQDGSQHQSVNKEHPKYGKHGRHEGHGGYHCMHHKWNMFRGLNLSKAQKEQIKGIMKGHHKEFTDGKIAVLKARQNLMMATTGATFDEAAVKAAYANVSAAQEKMVILRAKVFSEVMPILTPDQQAVVSGRLAKSKLRMQKVVSKMEEKQKAATEK